MESILSFLFSKNVITDQIFSQISDQSITNLSDVETFLFENGIDQVQVKEALAEFFAIPTRFVTNETQIPQDILSLIPVESAKHYRIVPIALENDILIIGTNNPEDPQVREAINFISIQQNIPIQFIFLLNKEIELILKQYDNIKGDVSEALTSLEQEVNPSTALDEGSEDDSNLSDSYEHMKEDAPVTKIVATILRYAVDGGASDIHIEPTEKKVKVRFRVDGVLQTSLELPLNTKNAVIARVKILSSLRLDERRKPQDGRFSAMFDGRKIDFRVSILPTNHGEKVVMRILDNEKGVRTLSDVGVSDYHLEILRRALNAPYGIILISGPTGSGKSTTLYSMLSEIDKETQNVMSLEDPVEYNMEGVSQSQMKPEIGYTFAAGLRSALRQDPDIIMVGEIRDKETAQLAIQAALTGHLVISTIHTNNAIGVIPRLIDMGVDPYLIAPTLKLSIAQRLARKLKPGTGIEVPVDKSTEMMIKDALSTLPEKYHNRLPASRTLKNPEPTPGCATGLRGRVAIMETLEIDDEIQSLILKNASEEDFFKAARSQGFMTMREDAITKALNHIIPPEEMNAFGTKIDIDPDIIEPTETTEAVDNLDEEKIKEAIIDSDENTFS
jgi:type IV pilus assembly protein PilB